MTSSRLILSSAILFNSKALRRWFLHAASSNNASVLLLFGNDVGNHERNALTTCVYVNVFASIWSLSSFVFYDLLSTMMSCACVVFWNKIHNFYFLPYPRLLLRCVCCTTRPTIPGTVGTFVCEWREIQGGARNNLVAMYNIYTCCTPSMNNWRYT